MRRKQRNTIKVPGDYLQVCRSISVSQFLHFTEQHHTNLHWHRSTIFITWNISKYKISIHKFISWMKKEY